MSLTKDTLNDLAQQCLAVIQTKHGEVDQAKQRLDGAAEGVNFLLSSLVAVLEKADGEDNKPVSQIAQA